MSTSWLPSVQHLPGLWAYFQTTKYWGRRYEEQGRNADLTSARARAVSFLPPGLLLSLCVSCVVLPVPHKQDGVGAHKSQAFHGPTRGTLPVHVIESTPVSGRASFKSALHLARERRAKVEPQLALSAQVPEVQSGGPAWSMGHVPQWVVQSI